MGPRALGEQLDGVTIGRRRLQTSVVAQRERRDRLNFLGLQRERLTAGREHRDARTRPQHAADEWRGGQPCSWLSTASSICLPAKKRPTACSADSPSSTTMPSARTIAAGTSSARCRVASVMNRAPSAKSRSTRGLEREPRLADPARARQRQQPHGTRSQPLADGVELAPATNGPIRRRRQPVVAERAHAGRSAVPSVRRWRGCRGWRIENQVVSENCLLEVVELGAGLDPELVDEDVAGVAVGLERVGLAAAAIQGEHQVRVQPLAPRVLGRELLKLTDQFGVAPAARSASTRTSTAAGALLLSGRSRLARTARASSASGAAPQL